MVRSREEPSWSRARPAGGIIHASVMESLLGDLWSSEEDPPPPRCSDCGLLVTEEWVDRGIFRFHTATGLFQCPEIK